MDEPIRVVVCGAHGRMGGETARAVAADPGLRLVGVVTRRGGTFTVDGHTVPAAPALGALLEPAAPQCVVDFTTAEAALTHGRLTLAAGLSYVTGTTGFRDTDLAELQKLSAEHGAGCVVAPNFALGAVLAAHFAAIAARYYSWAEIIELHHEQKADAPSGTALAMARGMAAARGKPFAETTVTRASLPGTRGGSVDGVHIHSVRLPGLVAHQEVLFGGQGELLSIRHDSLQRSSFMPGVLLAIQRALAERRYVYGLAPLLGL